MTERGKKRKPKFKPRPHCLGNKDGQRSDWVNMSVLLCEDDIPGSSLAGTEKTSRAEN